MLSKKTIASIAKLFKVEEKILTDAIANKDEVPIETIDNATLQVFTDDEITARDTNTKTAAKNEGIKVGKELLIKDLKDKHGIEGEGKDPETFLTNFKTKVLKEAKIEPNTQITELNNQIKVLQKNLETKDTEVSAAGMKASQAELSMNMLSSMPARNTAFSDSDYLTLIKSRISQKVEDGQTLYLDAAGEVFRDPKTGKALDLKASMAKIFADNPAWAPADPKDGGKGGRGGKSTDPKTDGGTGDIPVTYSEAEAAWKSQGKHVNSSDFALYVGKLKTDNKDFKMDLENVQSGAPSE